MVVIIRVVVIMIAIIRIIIEIVIVIVTVIITIAIVMIIIIRPWAWERQGREGSVGLTLMTTPNIALTPREKKTSEVLRIRSFTM